MEVNKEIQELIVSYTSKVEGAVQNMSDFASDQIPLVIQEYLLWHFYSNLVFMTFLLSLSLLFIGVGLNCQRLAKNVNKREDITSYAIKQFEKEYMILGTLSIMLASVFFFLSFVPLESMVKVKVAPRVVLIDWLKESVQK